jgi:hypothetical protein
MHLDSGIQPEAAPSRMFRHTSRQLPLQVPTPRQSRRIRSSMRDHPDIPLENRRSIGMFKEMQ